MKIIENLEFDCDRSSMQTAMISSNNSQISFDYSDLIDDLRTLLALDDLARYHKDDNECNPEIPVMGLPLLDQTINRILEMLIIIIFSSVLIYYRKVKHKYKSVLSRIRVVITFSFFAVCFFDNFFAIFYNSFPMVNFILRGLLIILLSRKLREEWTKIFFVIYSTRSIFFILFFCVIVFALLGHQIFQGEFTQIYSSIDAMFVVITTANFPDIMLKNLETTKFAIFFFIGYLLITYFVIVSLLKALYYANYLQIKKSSAQIFLRNLQLERISNDEKFKLKQYLFTLAKKYSLSKVEIEKFKSFIGEVDSFAEFGSINFSEESSRFSPEDVEELKIKQSRLLRVLRSKYWEIVINCLNIIFICLLVITTKPSFITLLHLLISAYFILEFIFYMKFYSLKKLICKKILRCLFFLLNLLGFIMHLVFIAADFFSWQVILSNERLLALTRILILLRSLRVFILLNMFRDFRSIFTTIKNMKKVFGSLVASLFSLFFVFSTFSIILFGGKITKEEYEKISSIPNEYANINFNDYASSFLMCFCLVIYNNMNTLIDHMCSHYDLHLKPFFTSFYFLAILIILNIFQTFVLDMYLNMKKVRVKVKKTAMNGNEFNLC